MPKPQIPTPAIPSSRFRPQGGPLFVRAAAWVCLLCSDTPPLAPGPPSEGERPHPGTWGRGHVCQEQPPRDTWLFAEREATEIKRLFSQWEEGQGGPGAARGQG